MIIRITEERRNIGNPTEYVGLSIGNTVNNPGIPTATRILNAFEPKILPMASERLLVRSDLIDTTSSGSDVPRAMAVILRSPGGTDSVVAIATTDSTTYFAPKRRPIRPIVNKTLG